jgi:hypothetical protein
MSITSNFPAIKPTLLLDFANTKQLDPRITFTRASTATYYGTQTAKAEENLLLQSQDFTTTWVNQATTDTTNTTVAPDGTTTADTITASAGAATHSIIQTITPPSGTNVLSVFAKAGTNNYIQLFFGGQTGTFANFDITAGAGATGTSSGVVSTAITSEGNNWYRCVVIFTQSTASSVQIGLVSSSSAVRAESWTTAGTETVILWGAQLEQRSAVTAYTVTTTQAITNYIPQLLTAASGVARFDNNPTTFESLGLLIEESRTNLVTYSEQFDNAAWTKTATTITANTIVAPDGALTGDKLVEDTTNTSHNVNRSQGVTTGTSYAFTVYAKAAERSFFRLQSFNATGDAESAIFNLTTGTIVSQSGTSASTITPVGNGWYRCSVIVINDTDTSSTLSIQLYSDGTTASYTGDGYSGIYIWGAQLEVGAFATSYIPTVASQVTRAADAASMTGTNFSSWYNAGQGTLYAEANTPSFATTYVFADINNNSTTTYIRQSTASTGTNTQFVISDNSVTTASPGVIVTLGSYRRMAGAYTADSVQQSVNGSLGTEDTSATIPSGFSQMNIGTRSSGASPVNGTIKKIAYYPLRVTNAQLQGLTS